MKTGWIQGHGKGLSSIRSRILGSSSTKGWARKTGGGSREQLLKTEITEGSQVLAERVLCVFPSWHQLCVQGFSSVLTLTTPEGGSASQVWYQFRKTVPTSDTNPWVPSSPTFLPDLATNSGIPVPPPSCCMICYWLTELQKIPEEWPGHGLLPRLLCFRNLDWFLYIAIWVTCWFVSLPTL